MRHFDKISVQTEIMTYCVLPAFVCSSIVGVVLGDVRIDPGEGELLLARLRDGLHDQLGVREGRLALILETFRVNLLSL